MTDTTKELDWFMDGRERERERDRERDRERGKAAIRSSTGSKTQIRDPREFADRLRAERERAIGRKYGIGRGPGWR